MQVEPEGQFESVQAFGGVGAVEFFGIAELQQEGVVKINALAEAFEIVVCLLDSVGAPPESGRDYEWTQSWAVACLVRGNQVIQDRSSVWGERVGLGEQIIDGIGAVGNGEWTSVGRDHFVVGGDTQCGGDGRV